MYQALFLQQKPCLKFLLEAQILFNFYFEIILGLQKRYKQFSFAFTQPPPKVNILYNSSKMIKTRKLTLVQYYPLKYRPYSNFTRFSSNDPLLFQIWSKISCCIQFSCLLRLLQATIILQAFFFLPFRTLTLLRSIGQLIYRISPILFCLMLSS